MLCDKCGLDGIEQKERAEQAETRYQHAMTDLAHAEHKLFRLKEAVKKYLKGGVLPNINEQLYAALEELEKHED
jgi:hypothetical protein